MKVLEMKPLTFAYVCRCTRCQSKLQVELGDLVLEPGYSDGRESSPERFKASCTVCSQSFYIPEKVEDTLILTDYVKHFVRSRSRGTGPLDR